MTGRVLLITTFIITIMGGTIISCNQKEKQEAPAINTADLDTAIIPGNDFDDYANGGWKKHNPIPPDRARYGTFDQLAEVAEKQLKDLVEETAATKNAAGSIADKIATMYNQGMDSVKIEENGIKPLLPWFSSIDSVRTMDGIQKEITKFHEYGLSPLFGYYGDADAKNSSMVIAQLSQSGMGLPDRDYYLNDDARSKFLRENYIEYIRKTFSMLGENESISGEYAKKIMEIETRLAKASMSRLELRDPNKTYNKTTTKALIDMSPDFNWMSFFRASNVGDPGEININQPEFIKEISVLLKMVPVEDWKIYLKWNLINGTAPYLSDEFVNASFDFYGKAMTGVKELRPRWKRVIGVTSETLSEALGKLYVEKYFPPEAKERMIKLVNNLRAAFAERIKNLDWMAPETKQKALEKLAAMNVKIGYPDKWRDYSSLVLKDDAYVLNVMRSDQFETAYNYNKINKPVDKSEWLMSPQTVNAYYSPDKNEIVFPAAILQPPFFYMHGDDAVNYGAIGVVIGHEMTHGFDDEGRKFDKYGNLKDWWTDEDSKRFVEHTKVLVDEFDSFVVIDSIHANGKLTLGENIADLGGLNISYQAFKTASKETRKIDGFTPDQRFFLAYAHVWASNIRDAEILRRTKEDVHSLGHYRVIGPLRNLPQFYAAFDVKPGQKMYLPDNQRAKIW
jgi:putative endopeptidase